MRQIDVTYVGGPFDGETEEYDRHLHTRWMMDLPTKGGRYQISKMEAHYTVKWEEVHQVGDADV